MPEKAQDGKVCFVVSAIGESNTATRLRANEVLDYVIKPVTEQFGYKTIRVDEIAAPGIITTDIIDYLINSSLVIADLSENNPNVYYEVGIRHAFGKPIILISEESILPFDLQPVRTIQFSHSSLTSVYLCKNQIAEQIKSIEDTSQKVVNPISQVATMESFKDSDKPIEKMLLELRYEMTNLNRQMQRFDSNFKDDYLLFGDTKYLSNKQKSYGTHGTIAEAFFREIISQAEMDDLRYAADNLQYTVSDVLKYIEASNPERQKMRRVIRKNHVKSPLSKGQTQE